MHCLETIIARNNAAAERALDTRIVREALLLIVNRNEGNAYLKMRVAEALRHLDRHF